MTEFQALKKVMSIQPLVKVADVLGQRDVVFLHASWVLCNVKPKAEQQRTRSSPRIFLGDVDKGRPVASHTARQGRPYLSCTGSCIRTLEGQRGL